MDIRALLPDPLLASQRELDLLTDWLVAQPALAVDTESNSYYVYYEQVCLIQISSGGADYVVDPLSHLDLSGLGRILADPAIVKVLHAAEQDVAGLRRDFGFQLVNLFDTMWAAHTLGWQRLGLASLLQDVFDVQTNKRYQRYDWGTRPLAQQAVEYAQMDTRYLLRLRDVQSEALQRAGRTADAEKMFERMARTPAAMPPFGPAGFARMKGARGLSKTERKSLRALYLWRDHVASRQDHPPFRVMNDQTLVALVRARPHTLDEVAAVPGITPFLLRRYGAAALAALERAQQTVFPPLPSAQSQQATLARYQALRAWRQGVAASHLVDAEMVVPNGVLWVLAEHAPTTPEELGKIEGLGPWKNHAYGPDLLRVIRDG